MEGRRSYAARLRRAGSGAAAALILASLCGGASPVRAQEEKTATERMQVIRASPPDTRVRFSLRRLLRSLAVGAALDRARIPAHIPLRGNEHDAFSARLTLARDAGRVTLRFRF